MKRNNDLEEIEEDFDKFPESLGNLSNLQNLAALTQGQFIFQASPDPVSYPQQFWLNQNQGMLPQKYLMELNKHWTRIFEEIENCTTLKNSTMPIARIKKIMKMDEEVQMISSEVPMLLAKAIEMFIIEITIRSWRHCEQEKRRILQKSDIALAIEKSDLFDFLIDIVPRSETIRKKGKKSKKKKETESEQTQQNEGNNETTQLNNTEKFQQQQTQQGQQEQQGQQGQQFVLDQSFDQYLLWQ